MVVLAAGHRHLLALARGGLHQHLLMAELAEETSSTFLFYASLDRNVLAFDRVGGAPRQVLRDLSPLVVVLLVEFAQYLLLLVTKGFPIDAWIEARGPALAACFARPSRDALRYFLPIDAASVRQAALLFRDGMLKKIVFALLPVALLEVRDHCLVPAVPALCGEPLDVVGAQPFGDIGPAFVPKLLNGLAEQVRLMVRPLAHLGRGRCLIRYLVLCAASRGR